MCGSTLFGSRVLKHNACNACLWDSCPCSHTLLTEDVVRAGWRQRRQRLQRYVQQCIDSIL